MLDRLRREQEGGQNDARAMLDALRAEQGETQQPATPPPQNTRYRSPFAPAVNAFRQGISLGFMDELGSLGRAALVSPFSERTFGQVYRDTMAEQRGELEQGRKDQPIVSGVSEFAGAMLPTSRVGSLLTQVGRNVPNWLKIGGLAGAEGAIYGAGTAEGDRATGAAMGGATGAIAGPVVSTLSKPLLTGGRNLLQLAGQKLTDTPTRQAERLAANALRDDAFGPREAQRLANNPNLVLADMGENITGLARGAAAKPGPFRSAADDFLRSRQTGQQGRLVRELGVQGPREFVDNFDDWAATRIKAADVKYDEAYSAPFDANTPGLQALMSRPAMQSAMRVAQDKIANEGGRRGPLALFDAAKRSLDDDIGAALRAGRSDDARILTQIKRQLVSELDAQVPAYREARSIFAGQAAVRNAADFGSELFKRNVSHDEARRYVEDMTEGELQAFQRGALRGLIQRLETTAENRNAAQKLIESTAVRDKLRLLFKDEQEFARFVQSATDEAEMTFTRNTVLGGSPTARIQEETRALTGAGEIMRDAITGNHLGLFSRFLRSLGYGDVSRETLGELSNLLLKPQSPQTLNRLTNLASRPPPGPISPGTQATVGGATGAMLGAGAGGVVSEQERRRRQLVEALRAGPELQ